VRKYHKNERRVMDDEKKDIGFMNEQMNTSDITTLCDIEHHYKKRFKYNKQKGTLNKKTTKL
jgi:hypothetical protein